MLETVKQQLNTEGIFLCSAIPLSDCRLTRRYLLDRAEIKDGTVIIFAVPYYTPPCGASNISAYARPRDYHIFMRDLGERLLSTLRLRYPEFKFAVFSDHSPIDERHAAATAGLGIIGDNGLLITESYSSYVFLGEIITSAHIACAPIPIRRCESCGACRDACPTGGRGCLSEITQKKGALTDTEAALLADCSSAWGCDICTEVCPHTVAARLRGTLATPVRFFNEQVAPYITKQDVLDMNDDVFSLRAYSWRGRETILRNLDILEDTKKEEDGK